MSKDELPADLRAVLEDAGCVIPRDVDVWELIGKWQKAPAATESAPTLAAGGACSRHGNYVGYTCPTCYAERGR